MKKNYFIVAFFVFMFMPLLVSCFSKSGSFELEEEGDVEIIVGIVVLSIALMGGLSLLISQVDTFKDPLIREKSAQISKRIIHEIQIRSFDEKSDIGGGLFRCGETVSGVSLGKCTPLQDYGPDSSEKVIVSLNDVDDFDTRKLCSRLTESYACTNGASEADCSVSLRKSIESI